MTSEKQVEANQANALLSTGAVTIEGKATIARNAVKHGIFTKDLILKSEVCEESEAEYQALLYGLVESLTPQGEIETLLVEKIAIDFWRLRRVIRFETGSIKKYLDDVLEDYYNPWRNGKRHQSDGAINEKIEELNASIDWNKKRDSQSLRKCIGPRSMYNTKGLTSLKHSRLQNHRQGISESNLKK